MSLVMCNVGSAPRSNRSNNSDQNTITSCSTTNPSARSSSAHASMPISSSASALNRIHGVVRQSPSSSTLHQASIANDNNNNSKNAYSENDEVNQVTIYRYGDLCCGRKFQFFDLSKIAYTAIATPSGNLFYSCTNSMQHIVLVLLKITEFRNNLFSTSIVSFRCRAPIASLDCMEEFSGAGVQLDFGI